MSQIIVGIDFSKTSILALQYALKIGAKTGLDILMVNVVKEGDYEMPFKKDEKVPQTDIEKNFHKLLDRYKDQIKGKLDYTIREGKVYEELTNQAKYTDAWLIITGAHGLSGFEEFWVGNNTYKIMTRAHCPVIAVRIGYPIDRDLKNIILPIDSTLETTQKVEFTTELARKFDSTIHVLSLYSALIPDIQDKVDNSTREALRIIKNAGVKSVQDKAVSDNITDSTIEYAKKNDGDLISMMTEQEFAPGNIFLGPYAEQMVNRSPIPVMSIRAKMLKREEGQIY